MPDSLLEKRAVNQSDLAELRAAVAGEVIAPADVAYEAQRRIWNADFDRRPALIVLAASVEDVVESLAYARQNGLEVTVRGGGHSFSGLCLANEAVLIDIRQMNRVSVDADARRVRVQGGATGGEMDTETQRYGLAVTCGQVSHTGIGGLTLSGGLGYAMRAHGLTIDSLLSAEVVLADGRVVQASANQHEDLFFGIRGGGGNFGIVTEFEFQLHPVGPTVLGGHLGWSREQGPQFLREYAKFLKNCPDALMTTLIYVDMPPLPFVPAAMRKKPGWILAVCGTGIAAAEAALALLRRCGPPQFDVVQPMPYLAVQTFLDRAEPFGTKVYGKSHFFNEVTEELLLTLHDQLADLPTHDTKVFSLQMGGAVRRFRDDEMAFTGRGAELATMFAAEWKDDAKREQCVAWVRRVWTATAKYADGAYNNFSRDLDQAALEASYGSPKYRKLQAIKAKYDPENIFRSNQNIQPATSARRSAHMSRPKYQNAELLRLASLPLKVYNVEDSVSFYCDVLGFTDAGASTRAPNARSVVYRNQDGSNDLEFELIETNQYWRFPNPLHLAFEAGAARFAEIQAALKRRGTKLLSAPVWETHTEGVGEWATRGTKYQSCFFPDPSLFFLELLYRLPTPWNRHATAACDGLKVNHFVVGARDLENSIGFYADTLGFVDRGVNCHVRTVRDLVHYSADGVEMMELNVALMEDWRLPSPSRFALEVDAEAFERVHANAIRRGVVSTDVQVAAASGSEARAAGSCATRSGPPSYRRFVMTDPAMIEVEIVSWA